MPPQQSNENERNSPDGHRWLLLDENSRYAYIVGFFEGMFLGHCFTTWGLPGDAADDPTFQNASNSYNEHWKKFVSGVVYRQFVEGLDKLYADDANRKIAIRDGMWIVMNQVSRLDGARMKVMIEAFREKTSEETSMPEHAMTYFKGQNLVH